MANEYSNDEELVTEKVEENKYALNRNRTDVDAYTNDEYVTNATPVVDPNVDDKYVVDTPILNSNFDEEYAAEVAPKIVDFNRREAEPREVEKSNIIENNVDNVTGGKGIGGLALALSILSLFVLPIILGAAGIIIGFIARRRGATSLGSWAIGIGAVSIIVGMFILPFF
jgi:hypothetical protein